MTDVPAAKDFRLASPLKEGLVPMLPVARHVVGRLIEMHVRIDVIDPRCGNDVMMPMPAALAGELDAVGAFHVVDKANGLPVRCYDLHVLLDL